MPVESQDVQREAKFVSRTHDITNQVQELQKRLSILEDALKPYSINAPTEANKEDQECGQTKMDNALIDLEYAIQDTHKQIDKLIENFRG